MKKIKHIVLLLMLIGVKNMLIAQELEIPKKAEQNFNNEFNTSNDIDVKWSLEEGMYVASFLESDEKKHVYYSENGTVLFVKTEVKNKLLMPQVKDYIKHNLSKKQVVNKYSVSSNAAPDYNQLLVVEKGKKYLITFTPEGKFHFKKEIK